MTAALGIWPRPLGACFHQARRWALVRSPSLVGLLYLPAPDDPLPAPRPRSAPTPLRPKDPVRLLRGEVVLRGRAIPLTPPLAWQPAEPDPAAAQLHAGEEALALFRLARAAGKPEPADLARRLLGDWMEQNPVASQPGWDGWLLARRLACWSAILAEHADLVPRDEQREWRRSLFLQARFLAANLERHEAGPRLVAGLRGLLAAGHVLAGKEPRRWLDTAARLLAPATAAQILPDGGHAGRSPWEHLQVLADLADCLELLPPEAPSATWVRARLAPLSVFARALAHPDGGPAGFGGSSRDRAPELAHVLAAARLASEPPTTVTTFPASGFTAFHLTEVGDAFLVDWHGPPTGTPAPGAAASLETSFAGERTVVTPLLTSPRARHRAHNSVAVDGRSFDESARLENGTWGEGPGFAYLGLRLRQGGLWHHRRVLFFSSRALAVVDRVGGAGLEVESLLHLEAGFRVREAGPRCLFLEKDDLTVTLAWMKGSRLLVGEAVVDGRAGEARTSTVLRLCAPGGGTRVLGYLLAEGRRRDAALDLLEGREERIALRFDPRRYMLRWDPASVPRVLLAD